MEHDLDRIVLIITLVALTPIVADRIREDVAGPVERRRHDTAADLRVALESVLGVFVPEVEVAVRAGGRESAVLRVEGDGVDAEAVLGLVRGGAADAGCGGGFPGVAVAAEGEVVADFLLFDVVDGTSAFYRTDGIAGPVVETADDSRLPLEG